MGITLTPELEKLVEDLVRDGTYENASEVVIDALRQAWVDPTKISPALKEMLLEGMESPSVPFTRETLEQIRQEAWRDLYLEKRGNPPSTV